MYMYDHEYLRGTHGHHPLLLYRHDILQWNSSYCQLQMATYKKRNTCLQEQQVHFWTCHLNDTITHKKITHISLGNISFTAMLEWRHIPDFNLVLCVRRYILQWKIRLLKSASNMKDFLAYCSIYSLDLTIPMILSTLYAASVFLILHLSPTIFFLSLFLIILSNYCNGFLLWDFALRVFNTDYI